MIDVTWLVDETSQFNGVVANKIQFEHDWSFSDDVDFTKPVVYHGSIQFIKWCESMFKSERPFPGSLGFGSSIRTENWMTLIDNEDLLNADYQIMMMKHARQRHESGDVFVRPVSAYKPFAGQRVVTSEDWLNVERVGDDMLVLVAPLRAVRDEFRFVVVDSQIVDYSHYHYLNEPDKKGCDDDTWNFVKRVVDQLSDEIDFAYTIDVAEVCETGSAVTVPKIIELNSFSSAGIYLCDPILIQNAVNEMVIKEARNLYY